MNKVVASIALVGLLAGSVSAEVRVYRELTSNRGIEGMIPDVGYLTSADYTFADTNEFVFINTCGDVVTTNTYTNPRFEIVGRDLSGEPAIKYSRYNDNYTTYRIYAYNPDGTFQSNEVTHVTTPSYTVVDCAGSNTTFDAETNTYYAYYAVISVNDAMLLTPGKSKPRKVREVSISYGTSEPDETVWSGGYETAPFDSGLYDDPMAGRAKNQKQFARNFNESWSGIYPSISSVVFGCGDATETNAYFNYLALNDRYSARYEKGLSNIAGKSGDFQEAVETVARQIAGKNGFLRQDVETEVNYLFADSYSFEVDATEYFCATTSSVFSVTATPYGPSVTYMYDGKTVIYPDDMD